MRRGRHHAQPVTSTGPRLSGIPDSGNTTEEGAIVLRPAGAAPIELYDEERIEAFLVEDELTPELGVRLAAVLGSERRS